MARVYFDGIAGSITREDLWEFFTRAGEVRGVLLMTDKVSGESRRFGCVDMATDADARNAINSLKDSPIKGGRIRIEQARPAENAASSKLRRANGKARGN
jgi:RNA recognition motif-containing protein